MYLTDREVACRFGVSRQTIWQWVREGAFPSPLRLTAGCTRWRVSDIEAWEEERRKPDRPADPMVKIRAAEVAQS